LITRRFPTIYTAWRGLVEELAYKSEDYAINWGMHAAFPDLVEVQIDDPAKDEKLDFGISSYTKSRWTQFLKKYFRPDFSNWIDASIKRLQDAPHRPYVAAYSMNINTPPERRNGRNFSGGPRDHNYGGCLSSLQIRIKPEPTVILYSRACAIDKTGFIDLVLLHHVAKRMPYKGVKATWVLSLGFISAISQIFYIHQFKRPLRGHALRKRVTHLLSTGSDHNYGPLKRIYKRKQEFSEHGRVLRSCPVSELSLEFRAD
jgi:hypothetical protein